jgi:anti-sigma factor RsiW
VSESELTDDRRLRCAGVIRFTDTYLDGEFGEVERAELDEHLAGCEACRAYVREQAAWRRAVRAAAPREQAPAALRARLEAALAAAPPPVAARTRAGLLGRLVSYAPYAAAAAIAAGVLITRGQHTAVTADVIAKHQRNLPLEITGRTDEVRRWYADKVDFPVRPPSFGALRQVALRGGRLANVRDRQAAYLLYDLDGNKVSVFIFDPGEMPLEARRHARIGDREVFFDAQRGYNVAVYQDQGVGYAIASDLDQGEMLRLVSAAVSR